MKRFWTADLHLGHANICRYTQRPWLKATDVDASGDWTSTDAALGCAERMNIGLVRSMNMRIGKDDSVMHVGDFCCRGVERGTPGLRVPLPMWLASLNGHWTFVLGNHDRNNGLRHGLQEARVLLGGYTAHVQHRPVDLNNVARLYHEGVDFVICGHVHSTWQTTWIGDVLHINVGVDAHKYNPLNDSEVVGIYERETRKRG
jgi:calcineurin-like phosphoesterase family protein